MKFFKYFFRFCEIIRHFVQKFRLFFIYNCPFALRFFRYFPYFLWIFSNSKISFCTIDEPQYPYKLLKIYDPPYGLFYKGKLPNVNQISLAVIGARACSNYGKEQSYYFAKQLAEKNVQIISGLARGVDGFAHSGAIAATKGKTFAVMGCGVDIIYPPEQIGRAHV